jgi:hypothetical protein
MRTIDSSYIMIAPSGGMHPTDRFLEHLHMSALKLSAANIAYSAL